MIVHARSRAKMWTAFTADDGRSILNVADRASGQAISVLLSDQDVAVFRADRPHCTDELVETLLSQGRRVTPPLPTPSVSEELRYAA